MGTQSGCLRPMPEWVNAALLASIAWIVPAGGQMQPRCVGLQGWLYSEINSGPKVTNYKSLPDTSWPTVIVVEAW